jgi:hypothetical protein
MTNSEPQTPGRDAAGAATAPAPLARPAPSPRQRAVLALLVMLFVGWLGYLALLAYTTRQPIVLSRPQLLVSNAIVIADLTGGGEHPDGTATVREVVWAGDPAAKDRLKDKVRIANLERANADRGWQGSGAYILPLTELRDHNYRLTALPAPPGFPAIPEELAQRVRIYPLTPSTQRQLDDIVRQFHPE